MTDQPLEGATGPDEAAPQPAPEDARPVRMCDVCGGVDDHPRHVVGYATPPEGQAGDGRSADEVASIAITNAQGLGGDAVQQIVGQIRDDTTTMRHMDCCREVGCPDGTCNQVTAGAENLRGSDLVGHLTNQNPEG